MKILPAVLCILFGVTARANFGNSVAASAVTTGGLVGIGLASGSVFWPKPLQGWRAVETNQPLVINSDCGVVGEAMLLGNSRQNYAFISVHNYTAEKIVVEYNRVRATFKGGASRLLEGFSELGAIASKQMELSSNWYGWRMLSFPAKNDFKGMRELTFQVPIFKPTSGERCVLGLQIHRAADSLDDPNNYIASSSFDITLGLGGALLRSGDYKNLGDFGAKLSMTMNGYYRQNHGVTLGLLFEGANDSGGLMFEGEDAEAVSVTHSFLGPSYRLFSGSTDRWIFQTGPGLTELTARSDGNVVANRSYLSWAFQAAYDRVFFRSGFGVWAGEYGFGVRLYSIQVFNSEESGTEFGGNSTGATIYIRVGY